jgi:hypothetical protein
MDILYYAIEHKIWVYISQSTTGQFFSLLEQNISINNMVILSALLI